MITWFRRLAQTWVAKALFVLLILSFGIWGIEDVVRNIWRETAVVRMEGGNIELPEAQVAARRELQRLQRQLGPAFEPDEAIRNAIARQAVEGLIGERAQRHEAQRMGVATPDSAVRDYVLAIPSFQLGGQFSRAILDTFLRQNDMTEAQFLQIVRDDLERIQLVGAVRAGAPSPASLANAIFRFERERRVARLVELPLLEAPEPDPPSDAVLARFHANNPERFSTPELREAVVAILSAETLADQVEVEEAELRAAFESRRASFETPERRDLQQALLPTEEAARSLAAAWRGNADFAALQGAATAAGGAALALGNLTRADLPIEPLAGAAFALPVGGVTDPVQSPFGWHVVRVAAITAGTQARLEDVADRLRQDLALEKAADLAFERANRVEDAIAGGADLAEAARRYGMAVGTVKLDAQGNDETGAPVPFPVAQAARPELLRAIFAAEPGRAPRLQELRQADAFVAVDLRAVVPPALKPFESVEADVRLAYATDARRRFQEERAAALLAAVRGGQTLEAAAAAAGLPSDRVGPFGRQPEAEAAPGPALPRELLPVVFGLRVNEPTMVPTARGFAVAQLLEIVAADPAADAAAVENARRSVQAQAADDIEAQFLAALRRRAEPRISPAMMQQVAP
ncbi:SurA N-terminal domain-containing protein [Falsiroseomonas sp. CW058]|uniref:peptidylprolyl isomerase n=1 Tax=Falsiroseomonas sp. CW058 TaxID=3388664 RepID=UPI003D31814D